MTDTDRLTLLETAADIRALLDVLNVDIDVKADDPEVLTQRIRAAGEEVPKAANLAQLQRLR